MDEPRPVQQQQVTEAAEAAAETAAVAATEAAWPQTRAVLRIIIIILLAAVVLWAFYALKSVLLLAVLAVFFAYLVAPLVELVRRTVAARGGGRVLPRGVAIGIVYAALFGSLGVGAWVLVPQLGAQIGELTKNAPGYLTNARSRADRLNKIYEELNLPPSVRNAASGAVTRTLDEVGNYVTGEGFTNVVHMLGYLPWLVLVPILAFFFLKDADSFRRSALRMLPQGRLRWRGDEFFQDVNSTMAAYIRAQLIACLLIGSVCTVGFYVLGVRYALVLGMVAGLLEFIPLLGPVVVAALALTVAGFDSVGKVVAVFVFLAVLRIVHDYVTYPRIIGSGIHLHPLAVILAILSGHEIAGVAGIFLAIPVIAVLTVTYRHWLEHRGSAGLVAELLKPAEQAVTAPAPGDADEAPAPEAPPTPAR